MKYLGILSCVFIIQTAGAQTCAPASKEMAQYFRQASWRQHAVEDGSGVPAVHGYIDEKNNFYFSDLTRSGSIRASMHIDPSNRSFFKYCRSDKKSFLRSMRRNSEGNSYKMTMRYLPILTGFANDPFVSQNYTESEYKILLNFDQTSSIDTQESYPDRVKNELLAILNTQARAQKEFGVIELDLTNWDDVVCDVLQGRVSIGLKRVGLSNAALVEQKKEIEPSELNTIYRAVSQQVSPGFEKEKAIFVASRTIAKLENDRQIGNWTDKKGFDVLKKLMNPEMSRVLVLDTNALICVTNQMQSYDRDLNQNVINVQFKLPSLDQVERQ